MWRRRRPGYVHARVRRARRAHRRRRRSHLLGQHRERLLQVRQSLRLLLLLPGAQIHLFHGSRGRVARSLGQHREGLLQVLQCLRLLLLHAPCAGWGRTALLLGRQREGLLQVGQLLLELPCVQIHAPGGFCCLVWVWGRLGLRLWGHTALRRRSGANARLLLPRSQVIEEACRAWSIGSQAIQRIRTGLRIPLLRGPIRWR